MNTLKTALVTGSSSGIGLGIAKQLLKNGYQVIIHGIEAEKDIAPTLKELQSSDKVLGYFQVDISTASAIEEFCETLLTKNILPDVLVNNAGLQHVTPITSFSKEKWNLILNVNLSSAFHFMRCLLPNMQQKKWGRIINIASAHGLVASKEKAAYVASKHGLLGLTKVAALENAGNGITCNTICPGWVLTPLVQKQIEKRAQEQSITIEKANENLLLEKQPSGQFVRPEDIGSFVCFLCSDEAAQITGASLSIDGGWTAQ